MDPEICAECKRKCAQFTCCICESKDVCECAKVKPEEKELIDKIANFLEREENWSTLKRCWLENGRSEDLRKLLVKAIKE